MSEVVDPRARFRELPERVQREELVETSDAGTIQVVETEIAEAWRTALHGSVP
ncbi:hypothetical protein [Modestobacter versicolor]|uniref:hypothetical protein n=1 Tax=Modestobacter versicolor TaxID=429133 RepID=UPI0034DE7E44